jgi:hypothetical protein
MMRKSGGKACIAAEPCKTIAVSGSPSKAWRDLTPRDSKSKAPRSPTAADRGLFRPGRVGVLPARITTIGDAAR